MNQRIIDPERLAAFLEGRLDPAARAAMVEELSHADPETLIAFGDAASIVRDAAHSTPRVRLWSRRSILVGATLLAAAVAFAAVMLPRYLGRNGADQESSAHFVALLDSAARGAQPVRVLDVSRGGERPSAPSGSAVRLGAHITDLGVAVERGDSTASSLAATLATECEAIPGGGAAGAAYRQLVDALRAGRPANANDLRLAAATAQASAGEAATRLGAWIQAARYAAAGRDASFFARPESRTMLEHSAAMPLEAGDQTAMSDLRREATRPNIDWALLAGALNRALRQLAN